MRALILVLSALTVGLAVSIVVKISQRTGHLHKSGPTLYVGRLLADTYPGEQVTYQELGGRGGRQIYTVEQSLPPEMYGVPTVILKRTLLDHTGQARGPGAVVTYKHRITDHGWFPLTAPNAEDALDRVWIVREIRRDEIMFGGRQRACWRVDLIDPALPEPDEAVVAWLDEEVPVFGLLQWKRADETWVLVDWSPKE